ncbi:MAG: hypothetical protein HY644_14935 [Acidobacteria bacterium]|nr:hypothetical protein [Acidobacteriota bacterium]
MTDQHFRKRDKLPIKLLNLGETEELFVTQCKLRPAIVLLPSGVLFEDLSKRLRQMGKGQFEKEVLGVIPYTAFRRKTPTRASPK